MFVCWYFTNDPYQSHTLKPPNEIWDYLKENMKEMRRFEA